METYRMIIKAEDAKTGKTRSETIRHIPADQVDGRRQAVRKYFPQGSVFGVKVVREG